MNIKLPLATILASATLWLSSPAEAQPTRSIGNGVTTLRLSSTFSTLLRDEGIQIRPFEESTTVRGTTLFPINEGVIDFANASGEIEHAGGQRLVSSDTAVRLINYIIDSTQPTPTLTAALVVNDKFVGRAPLFDVKFSNLSTPLQARRGTLRFTNVTLTLRSEGALALNEAFGTTAFVEGQAYGTASINMTIGKSATIPIRTSSRNVEE